MASVCNVMRRRNTRSVATITTKASNPPADLRVLPYAGAAPTWWSIVRHDHGFRIPRPDLSAKLGTPNACNDCHTDKSPEWAAAAIERWHGPNREGLPEVCRRIPRRVGGRRMPRRCSPPWRRTADTPAFARAGALAELRHTSRPQTSTWCRTGLRTPTRWCGSARSTCWKMYPLRSSGRWPRRCWPTRSAACASGPSHLLAAIPAASQPPADRERFERAAAEFIAAQRLNADRPEARSALGDFYARRGRSAEAEAEYKAALRLSPQYAPAAINLADLYRELRPR